jgi:acetate---CoA ligase (ADP-forming)
VLNDTAIWLASFNEIGAIRQIDSIKSRAILGDFRGMTPVDKQSLAGLLVSLGHLSIHFPQIREIDLNTIFMVKGNPVVVDALIVL